MQVMKPQICLPTWDKTLLKGSDLTITQSIINALNTHAYIYSPTSKLFCRSDFVHPKRHGPTNLRVLFCYSFIFIFYFKERGVNERQGREVTQAGRRSKGPEPHTRRAVTQGTQTGLNLWLHDLHFGWDAPRSHHYAGMSHTLPQLVHRDRARVHQLVCKTLLQEWGFFFHIFFFASYCFVIRGSVPRHS